MAELRLCSVDGCGKEVRRRSMCDTHYMRWWKANRKPPKQPKPCRIDGCGKPVDSRGYCSGHAHRLRRYGDPLGGFHSKQDPILFFQNVVLTYEGDDCLIWPYARTSGYGRLDNGEETSLVHRRVCQIKHGPPPTPKHHARHTCGNGHKGCCNWRHTEWGTAKQNAEDRAKHGTSRRGKKHICVKVTEEMVREIRSLEGTMAGRKIAHRFGIGETTVRYILKRQSWKHV